MLKNFIGILALVVLCCASTLAADPYININALEGAGYTAREDSVGVDAFGGIGGCTIDPANHQAYFYYDGLQIRRVDNAAGTDVVINTPAAPAAGSFGNAQGGVYGSFLAFDPANANLLYFAESTNNTLRRLALSSSDRNVVTADVLVYTAPAFNFIFDIAFDTSTSPARMLLSESQGFGSPNSIVYVDRSSGPAQRIEIGEVSGPSGSLDTDINGDLYYSFPQGFGPTGTFNAVDLVRWSAAQLNAAIADPVNDPLTDVPTMSGTASVARSVVFGAQFSGMGSILVRNEAGSPVVYAGNNDLGTISRLDLANPLNDDLSWATSIILTDGVNFIVEPGNLSTTSKTAEFSANSGQWDSGNSTPTASIMSGIIYRQPASTGETKGAVARILPNSQVGEIASIAVVDQPSEVTVGKGFSVGVELRDGGGRRITTGFASRQGGIISTLNGNGVLLGPDPYGGFTPTSSISEGLLTLGNYRIDTAQTGFSIAFMHTSSGETTSTQAIDAFEAGTQIEIGTQPTEHQTNTNFSITAIVQDSMGNTILQGADASAALTISVMNGNGVLSGTTTVTASNGVAVFNNLRYTTAEGAVTFTISGAGLTDGVTSGILFTPGVAQISITTQPAAFTKPGQFIALSVEIRDATGSRITNGAHNAVDVMVEIASGSGALEGTLVRQTVAGSTSFVDLRISQLGSYTLRVSTINGVENTTNTFIIAYDSPGKNNGNDCSITAQPYSSTSVWAMLVAILGAGALLLGKRRDA